MALHEQMEDAQWELLSKMSALFSQFGGDLPPETRRKAARFVLSTLLSDWASKCFDTHEQERALAWIDTIADSARRNVRTDPESFLDGSLDDIEDLP
jgi:hypothetical protein